MFVLTHGLLNSFDYKIKTRGVTTNSVKKSINIPPLVNLKKYKTAETGFFEMRSTVTVQSISANRFQFYLPNGFVS